MIRIMLVDDHPIVREGLRGMLNTEDDFEVVGDASSGPQGVTLCRTLRPDVVLMDLQMPGGDGVTATREIVSTYPDIKVLILTTYETDADIVRAVEAGASGYLLKDIGLSELARSIRSARDGGTVLAPSVAASLVSSMRHPEPTLPKLSAREIEVLRLVAEGMTNSSIGRRLYISEATVKTHLLRAYQKLDVDDRTAAVTRGVQLGVLTLSPWAPALS
ncbi:DNA-binding NarL/FixJ family response regulator [Nakamurella sp. UYEF19]|uniref:response regulator transcription factor n=1 Tax=Nakamurella sp. UYEF19 TaxID=1756392 RepID=UPI003397B370